MNVTIPVDVPRHKRDIFEENYLALTHDAEKFVLFAADQKIEHVADAPINPEIFFKIAVQGRVGALATQLGLIARYGAYYPNLDYIAKLNSRTDMLSPEVSDPISEQLWSVQDVVDMAENAHLGIRGVGYTVYLGSEHESIMLAQAAQIVRHAHMHGLVAILWVYPRGRSVPNPRTLSFTMSAVSVAACLGADFVKVNMPELSADGNGAKLLQDLVRAAGNTKVICAGGPLVAPEDFLKTLYHQLHEGGIAGCATGRNIYSHDLDKAVGMTRAMSALVYDGASLDEAKRYL